MNLIWAYLRRYKKILFGALFLATVNQVFSLLDPQIFRLIIDRYASRASELPRGEFASGVFLLILASVGVAMVSRVAKNFQDYFVNVVSERVGASMYGASVKHALSLPYSVFEDQRSGELLRKLEKARLDTKALIGSAVNTTFLSLVSMAFIIVYAFIVHWLIGLSYVLIIPIMGVTTYLITRKIKDAQAKIVKQSAELAGSTTETLRNVELVKSLGLEDQEIERLNDVNDAILVLELKKVKLVRALSFVQGTLVNAMRSGILFLMLYFVSSGAVSLGQFFTLFIYSFALFGPLAEFGNVAAQYQGTMASSDALREVLKTPAVRRPVGAVRVGPVRSIEFKSVSFRYVSGEESLKNVSFAAQGGETLAFVGPSGSGKTTLIKLIVGLYDASAGKILLNGTEVSSLDYDDLRRRIGFVSQETQLFAGTIRENLLFVSPEATDEECLTAVKQAAATSLLERGGEGLETKIGEGGIKVSGGERQRLAIARALLRRPEILIFDEATSSLDSITERAVTETIRAITKNRPHLITILIAHRLSTVLHADRIYVLEKGKIVEAGGHTELLERKGLYYALAREQGLVG